MITYTQSVKHMRYMVLYFLLGALITACSSSQSNDENPNLIKQAVQFGGFATTPPANTPDFIQSTRAQAKNEFVPVGSSAAPRALTLKTAAEVEAVKNELSQIRNTNDAKGAEAKKMGALPTVQSPNVSVSEPDLKLRQ